MRDRMITSGQSILT